MSILKNFLRGQSRRNLEELRALEDAIHGLGRLGVPVGKYSRIFIVDPQYGDDDNTGLSLDAPKKSVASALADCVTNRNDCIVMVGGPTADAITTAITWDKSYTHLVGLSADLGVGQRCRITGGTATDLAALITVSGNGCIFRNVQFANFADKDEDSGAAIVSGSRNLFQNCMFAGMGHATPGARAGAYSLAVSGSENLFTNCAIGLDTIVRAAANAELKMLSGATRNTFKDCRFLSASETAGKALVSVADGVDRWNEWCDCIFQNFSVNWAVSLSNAFLVSAASTHQLVLRGACMLVGVTGWADTVTHIYSAAPQSNAGFGVTVSPTT